MPNTIRDIKQVFHDEETNVYFERDVSIPIPDFQYPIRCNVYRPLASIHNDKPMLPVIVTYGPYGKDIEYAKFHAASFAEVNPKHKSKYSAWETPDPVYWTGLGYAVVRCDERGFGQSPGFLDPSSNDTAHAFYHAIEWAAAQPWSNGKVGLLGVSYFAATQWRAAARKPRGLACIVPWEGMSDHYRDRCRHGGILSDAFIRFWWNRQIITNQYGLPGRAARGWGPNTIEGDLSGEELAKNRRDQNVDTEANQFLDQEYYASRAIDLEDVTIPLLSAVNLGNIGLHLPGNVLGYMFAKSKFKYMRFLAGRHDLPFYYDEEVEVQRSFLDAWLKGQDSVGWAVPGKVAPISLLLREGDIGYNNAEAERKLQRRDEFEWPLERTNYVRYYLTSDLKLQTGSPQSTAPASTVEYKALGDLDNPSFVTFRTDAFEEKTEITCHIVANLHVSVTGSREDAAKDIDLFVTLRHLDRNGKEIVYTGAVGDPMSLTRGWLRCSLRKVNESHPRHRPYLPHRDYFSTDEQLLRTGEVCEVKVEIWPTSVVLSEGHVLAVEVASGDTEGCGLFQHKNAVDRPVGRFGGQNRIHFGDGRLNYVEVPVIPTKE